MWITAHLAKRATADGLFEMEDDVPLGKAYRVDPTTIRPVEFVHVSGVVHTKRMIDDELGGQLPVELLSFYGEDEFIHVG